MLRRLCCDDFGATAVLRRLCRRNCAPRLCAAMTRRPMPCDGCDGCDVTTVPRLSSSKLLHLNSVSKRRLADNVKVLAKAGIAGYSIQHGTSCPLLPIPCWLTCGYEGDVCRPGMPLFLLVLYTQSFGEIRINSLLSISVRKGSTKDSSTIVK
jgi:hypothetical protein